MSELVTLSFEAVMISAVSSLVLREIVLAAVPSRLTSRVSA